MDLNLQMRSIELLLKFLRHDLQDLPPYGYRLQKEPVCPAPVAKPFPRATPERMGLPSASLLRFFRELDARARSLSVHSALLLRHGHVIAEGHWAPYRAGMPHMLFSMSKSFTGTAVGMACEEGLLSLEEKLVDIFPELATPAVHKAQGELLVRHLLTMSSGSRFNEIGSALDGEWAKQFLAAAPRFACGSAFDYNSLNSYMLAAVLRRKTGQTLVEYLRERLFEPLGISQYHWETSPEGVEKGGWGLDLRVEDCAKLGQLYLQKGLWEGRRLLGADWIEAATRAQIETPNAELSYGYGYQLWPLEEGDYIFNGAFGQFVLVMPRYDAVAAFTGGCAHFFAEGPLYGLVQSCFWAAADEALPENPSQQEALARLCASLRLPCTPPAGFEEGLHTGGGFEALLRALDGREYRLVPNTGSLFPQTLQSVHGNYSAGVDMLRFDREGDALRLDIYEGLQRNTLRLREGVFTDSFVSMRAEVHMVSASLLYRLEENGDFRLFIPCSFIETPCTRLLCIRCDGGRLHVVFEETPDVMRACEMLFDLISLNGRGHLKRLTGAMRRMPGMSEESVADLMRRFSRPRAEGGEILGPPPQPLAPPALEA